MNGGSGSDDQIGQMVKYRDWLVTEAKVAGGIGPAESERVERRHLTDSLLFLELLPVVASVLDVGSGVGLPGIPLAIARPQTEFKLLDRSGRRVDLMRRAIRILGLENAQVVQGDFARWSTLEPAIVSRATIPPQAILPMLKNSLVSGGTALLGGSWTNTPSSDGYETREVGAKILDQPVWILMMQQT